MEKKDRGYDQDGKHWEWLFPRIAIPYRPGEELPHQRGDETFFAKDRWLCIMGGLRTEGMGVDYVTSQRSF